MIINIDKKPENMSQEQWDNLTKIAEQYFKEDFKDKKTSVKFSNEQIKQALQCCKKGLTTDCDNCPCFSENDGLSTSQCMERLMSNSIDIINQLEVTSENQKAEIEKIKSAGHKCLTASSELIDMLQSEIKTAKTDAVKNFASELTKKLNSLTYNPKTSKKTVTVDELKEQVDWVLHEVVLNCINTLVKEKESKV